MTRICCFLVALIVTTNSFSQSQKKSITVKKTNASFVADGILDETAWNDADKADEFWQYFPSDSTQAKGQSEIKMLYDDSNLYIAITVFSEKDKYVVPTLKRDFRAGSSDNITLLFDTFNDATNAYFFGTNPLGVRREGLISGGGQNRGSFSTTWDTKWKGNSKIYSDKYIAEFIIPLANLKFNEGGKKWGFNCYRFDTQGNEQSTWMRIPQNQGIFSVAFMGDMIFEEPLGNSKSPISLIPYINGISSKDYENNVSNSNFKVGGDAKIAIGNSMNLDITVNPDFSQVEVDNQVTNLTRFEVSLPEKRQFFIDNSDLFSSFGGGRDANPFFSRRIGIARDINNNSIENKILGGVRLSGKLNEDWRLGFLSIQTDEDVKNEIASNNNTMFALQKKVFSRSNIGMFFINKESFKDYDFIDEEDKFNRVFGIDYNLASENNKWNGKFYAHKSFEPKSNGKDLSTGAFLSYNVRKFNVFTDWVYIGDDFRSDLGFIRRTDIFKVATGFGLNYYPKSGPFNTHGVEFFNVITWRPELDFKNTDYSTNISWEANFKDQTEIGIGIRNNYTFLNSGFDPTGTGGTAIPGNTDYKYTSVEIGYESDRRKKVSYSINPEYGEFYNGQKFSFSGGLNMRFQPKALLSLNVNYDAITMPSPQPSAEFWLISPKVDITFSKTVFWSTLIQYSNQRDNLGFNSRLQWRFAPLSDLFLVYNDNYFVNSFEPRSRSINLKLTYWLNI